eukprot:497761-Pyramimonas_sp.AAC.1
MMNTFSQTRPVSVDSSHSRGLPIVVMVTRQRRPTPRPATGRFVGFALIPNANPFEEEVLLGAMAASLDLSVANRPDLFAGPVTVVAERSSSARRGQS